MPTVSLTKRTVDAAAPEVGDGGALRRVIYWDTALKGFGLLVTERGAKSYLVQYRAGNHGRKDPTRRVTIGKHGSPWTPETARAEAKRILGAVAHGSDPAADLAAARTAVRKGPDQSRLVSTVVENWLRRDQAKNRSLREIERIMAREVLPFWGEREIDTIRKRDVIELIDRIADRGTPTMANRTLAHVRRLFNWAAGRDVIAANPAQYVEKPAPEVKRERTLNEAELVAVWRAAEATPYPFGHGVRLLIATGARREEVFGLPWSEIDLDRRCIDLPAVRSKNAEGRLVHLSALALDVLAGMPRLGPYALSGHGETPFTNIGHSKAKLDAVIARQRAEARLGRPLGEDERPEPCDALTSWRLHDLRRSVATGLQRLGVRLEVIETVLGHVAGSRAGIVGTYQKHALTDEARAALGRWGAHVAGLLTEGAPGKIVALRRHG